MRQFFLIIIFLWIPAANASGIFASSVDSSVSYSLQNKNIESDSSDYSLGLTISYGLDRWFAAGKYRHGWSVFTEYSDIGQQNDDIEFNIGYQFNKSWSGFFGLRSRQIQITETDTSLLYSEENLFHYGLGGVFSRSLVKPWHIKAHFSAYYLTSDYKTGSEEDSGNGVSTVIGVGFIRPVLGVYTLAISAKVSSNNSFYTSGESYWLLQNSLGLSISRLF